MTNPAVPLTTYLLSRCLEHGIEHRLTKPYHPWTNGQAERMNRPVKDATDKTFHYDDIENLKAHVLSFVTAYNFANHLEALSGKHRSRAFVRLEVQPVSD